MLSKKPSVASNDSDSEGEDHSSYKVGGYHPVTIGESYKNGRYTIEKKLGWGHFSTVWLASDNTKGDDHPQKLVAIKIQKSSQQYAEAALDEIDLLNAIKEESNADNMDGSNYVVQLFDHFTHTGPHGEHTCLVFEVMGKNILKLIQHYDYRGAPPYIVKIMSRQLLKGLDFLHTRCRIIHTDLKPENFLMLPAQPYTMKSLREGRTGGGHHSSSSPIPPSSSLALGKSLSSSSSSSSSSAAVGGSKLRSSSTRLSGGASNPPAKQPSVDPVRESIKRYTIKISDLGNGCWIHKHFTDDITTRQYRAPEVIVGLNYSTPVDIWATACIIFELLTGDFLFDPKNDPDGGHSRNEDHLALMHELLGKFPKKFYTNGRHSRSFFNRKGDFLHIKELQSWPLEHVLVDKYGMSAKEAQLLSETLLLPMLRIDPDTRITAVDALKSDWLRFTPVDVAAMYLEHNMADKLPLSITLQVIDYEIERYKEVYEFVSATRFSTSRLERYLRKHCPLYIWLKETRDETLLAARTRVVNELEQYYRKYGRDAVDDFDYSYDHEYDDDLSSYEEDDDDHVDEQPGKDVSPHHPSPIPETLTLKQLDDEHYPGPSIHAFVHPDQTAPYSPPVRGIAALGLTPNPLPQSPPLSQESPHPTAVVYTQQYANSDGHFMEDAAPSHPLDTQDHAHHLDGFDSDNTYGADNYVDEEVHTPFSPEEKLTIYGPDVTGIIYNQQQQPQSKQDGEEPMPAPRQYSPDGAGDMIDDSIDDVNASGIDDDDDDDILLQDSLTSNGMHAISAAGGDLPPILEDSHCDEDDEEDGRVSVIPTIAELSTGCGPALSFSSQHRLSTSVPENDHDEPHDPALVGIPTLNEIALSSRSSSPSHSRNNSDTSFLSKGGVGGTHQHGSDPSVAYMNDEDANTSLRNSFSARNSFTAGYASTSPFKHLNQHLRNSSTSPSSGYHVQPQQQHVTPPRAEQQPPSNPPAPQEIPIRRPSAASVVSPDFQKRASIFEQQQQQQQRQQTPSAPSTPATVSRVKIHTAPTPSRPSSSSTTAAATTTVATSSSASAKSPAVPPAAVLAPSTPEKPSISSSTATPATASSSPLQPENLIRSQQRRGSQEAARHIKAGVVSRLAQLYETGEIFNQPRSTK